VQEELHSNEAPNVVRLSPGEANRVVERMSVHGNQEARRRIQAETTPGGAGLSPPKLEVGLPEVSEQMLSSVSRALELMPPVPYELSRQVRVFEPYIQYVATSLRSCAIKRMRVAVLQFIMHINVGSQPRDRLKTAFYLIHRDSAISSKQLEGELREIRDAYTQSLSTQGGRVQLGSKRQKFDETIEESRKKVPELEKRVREELKDRLEESQKQFIDYFKQIVFERSPRGSSPRKMSQAG